MNRLEHSATARAGRRRSEARYIGTEGLIGGHGIATLMLADAKPMQGIEVIGTLFQHLSVSSLGLGKLPQPMQGQRPTEANGHPLGVPPGQMTGASPVVWPMVRSWGIAHFVPISHA